MKTIFLFLIFALQCPMVAQSDPFIATIEHAKLSIIPVACGSFPDDPGGVTVKMIWGTGFFVNFQGDFVTAGHVIKEHFKWNAKGNPDPSCFPIVYLPNPGWPSIQWFKFERCITDEAVDIAVCSTTSNPFGMPKLHPLRLHLLVTNPPDGTLIAFTGFPLEVAIPVTSRGNVASIGVFAGGQPEIMVNGTTWGGISGGPLYLVDGSVIGVMLRMGLREANGMAFARPTSSVLDFLRKNKIVIWQEEPQQNKDKK